MLKRIVAVTVLGVALGLAACDQGGQEQAQTPARDQQPQQTQQAPPSPPMAEPAHPTPPANPPVEQAPTTPPPGGTGSGAQ